MYSPSEQLDVTEERKEMSLNYVYPIIFGEKKQTEYIVKKIYLFLHGLQGLWVLLLKVPSGHFLQVPVCLQKKHISYTTYDHILKLNTGSKREKSETLTAL